MENYLSRRDEFKENEELSVLSTLLKSEAGHKAQPLSKRELMAEGRSLLAAGVNTIGFALSATLFYIARDKEVQLFLQTELDVHESHFSESTSQQTIAELPYLVRSIVFFKLQGRGLLTLIYTEGCLY